MQAEIQIFEMSPKGTGANVGRKVANHVSSQTSKAGSGDEIGFFDIMETLTDPRQEQTQTSMEQLDWVAVDEAVATCVPVIQLNPLDQEVEAVDQAVSAEASDQLESSPTVSGEIHSEQMSLSAPEKTATPNTTTPHLTEVTLSSDNNTWEGMILQMDAVKNNAASETKTPSATASASDHQTELDTSTDKATSTAGFQVSMVAKGLNNTTTVDDLMATVQADHLEGIETGKEEKQTSFQIKESDAVKVARAQGDDIQKIAVPADEVTLTEATQTKKGSNVKSTAESNIPSTHLSDAGTSSATSTSGNVTEQQTKETTAKEQLHQQVRTSANQADPDSRAVNANSSMPDSTVKDTSLSFVSRWSQVTEMSDDGINTDNTTETTFSKTDQSDVIRQIVQRMTLKNNTKQSQMTIKLKPEFLGNVRMQVTTNQQQVAVRMMADSDAVKEVLEQNIHVLKSELQQHGLVIDKFDVYVGGGNDGWQSGQQMNWQRQFGQKGKQSFREDDASQSDSKENDNMASAKSTGNRITANNGEIDYFA